MNVLAQDRWSFTLEDHGDRLLLVVVCGTVAVHDVVLELSDDEQAAWSTDGVVAIRALAARVQARPQAYLARSVRR